MANDTLFESGIRKVNIQKLAAKTGIPSSTLYRYKKLGDMPFSKAKIIARAIGLTDEEWARLR